MGIDFFEATPEIHQRVEQLDNQERLEAYAKGFLVKLLSKLKGVTVVNIEGFSWRTLIPYDLVVTSDEDAIEKLGEDGFRRVKEVAGKIKQIIGREGRMKND